MHARANALQLLHDETPPRRGLEVALEATTGWRFVVASSATSSSWPSKRAKNLRTHSRCAGATRERESSPVAVSTHSVVICARC